MYLTSQMKGIVNFPRELGSLLMGLQFWHPEEVIRGEKGNPKEVCLESKAVRAP